MRPQYQMQSAAEPDLDTAEDFIRLTTDDICSWLGPDRYEEFRQDLVAQWHARHSANA